MPTLHQRLHLQDGMALLAQPAVQFFAVAGNVLVSDVVHEVLNAVEFLGSGIQPLAHIVFEFLGHPDDSLDAALSGAELLGSDEVTAMAHVAGSLDTAAGAGSQTPGYMGHGRHFISSKKFVSAEGGVGRIVWMPKELKDDVAERLNATAKELLGIDNFVDMIADETITTDCEELYAWLTEKNHPVLGMEPLM